MTIPLQFASLYDRQEMFVWSDCLLDLGTDFLVGNMLPTRSVLLGCLWLNESVSSCIIVMTVAVDLALHSTVWLHIVGC